MYESLNKLSVEIPFYFEDVSGDVFISHFFFKLSFSVCDSDTFSFKVPNLPRTYIVLFEYIMDSDWKYSSEKCSYDI